jgi:hypothetical protein
MNYPLIYTKIVERAKRREYRPYRFHKHHVIPTCMGGLDTLDNLALVTIKEHYLLHLILARLNPEYTQLRNIACVMAANIRNQKVCPLIYIKNPTQPNGRNRWAKIVGQMPLEDRRLAARHFISMIRLDCDGG